MKNAFLVLAVLLISNFSVAGQRVIASQTTESFKSVNCFMNKSGSETCDGIATSAKNQNSFVLECKGQKEVVSGGCMVRNKNLTKGFQSVAVLQGSTSGSTGTAQAWLCFYTNLTENDEVIASVTCK